MVRNNATEFSEVASKQEIVAMLDSLKEKSDGVQNTFLQENIQNLQSNIETTKTKIQSVRAKG